MAVAEQSSHKINIVMAADNNYAQHTAVAMTSILLSTQQPQKIVFYLLSDGILEKTKEKIGQTITKLGSRLLFIDIDEASLTGYYVSGQLSRTAYCRLDMVNLLPATVEKAIYMDCDLLVYDDIKKLWTMGLQGHPIGAAVDLGIMASRKSRQQKAQQINLGKNEPYFNSGVLIIDFHQWRQYDYGTKVKELAQNNDFVHHDQDALNVLFKDNWQEIPLRWNVIPPVFNLFLKILQNSLYRKQAIEARQDIAVMHYAGGYKPWEYEVYQGFNEYYYECLAQTEFRDAKMPQLDKRRKHRSISRQMFRLRLGDIWQKLFR